VSFVSIASQDSAQHSTYPFSMVEHWLSCGGANETQAHRKVNLTADLVQGTPRNAKEAVERALSSPTRTLRDVR
jgi:hypothetical protein